MRAWLVKRKIDLGTLYLTLNEMGFELFVL